MTQSKKNRIRETMTFFKRWACNPFQMGSVMPSSKTLAKMMAKSALENLAPHEMVLELGSGTGPFTRALLEAGLQPHRLISMEIDPILVDFLKDRFPNISVIKGNAVFLKELIPAVAIGHIGVIVSGLPMLTLSPIIQDKILRSCADVLSETGSLIQFTYSPFSSISAKPYGMEKKHLGCVWKNMPPANVWRYTRVETV